VTPNSRRGIGSSIDSIESIEKWRMSEEKEGWSFMCFLAVMRIAIPASIASGGGEEKEGRKAGLRIPYSINVHI